MRRRNRGDGRERKRLPTRDSPPQRTLQAKSKAQAEITTEAPAGKDEQMAAEAEAGERRRDVANARRGAA